MVHSYSCSFLWARISVGREARLQREGRRFESCRVHHFAWLAQLVRAIDLHSIGHRFESCTKHHLYKNRVVPSWCRIRYKRQFALYLCSHEP